ncbi:MAG: hypothetical protein OEY89_17175 [Gammaproteobacteria bacterium]|nr:hypothetical protein [Gammaproteobacteria bacterium]
MCTHLHKTAYNASEMLLFVVSTFFCLLLIYPQTLCAETVTAVENTRTQKELAFTPKNSEEFLSRLKTLLQDKDNTGLNFAKKLTGVELEKWNISNNKYDNNDFYRDYSYNYMSYLTVDDHRDNIYFIFRIGIDRINKVKPLYSITPEITQLYLGKPSKILSYIDDKTENSNSSQLIYRYNINNFIVRIQYEINPDTPLEVIYDRDLIEDYKHHKSFWVSKIIISRPNPLKLQHSGVGSKFVENVSTQIPKNANELLQRINSTRKNPKKSISSIAEVTTGVNLSKWKKTQNEKGMHYALYMPLYDLEDYPDFPYYFHLSLYGEKSLFLVNVRYLKTGTNYNYNMNPIVCITPEETKNILGEPSTITGIDQRTTEGKYSQTKYLYENDETVIEFIYPNQGGNSKEYIEFIQHKQFCASKIKYMKK